MITAAATAGSSTNVEPLIKAKILPPAREIPATFMSSARSWWATGQKEGAASEERLLRMLPFYQSSTWPRQNTDLPVVGTSSRVVLSSPKRFLNMFAITPTTPSSSPSVPPAVLLHGFGAGLGFYFRNFPALATWVARTGVPVYSLDWLGMGRSARVPFIVRAIKHDIPGRVSQAENFFLDALEEWRVKQGLERMTLVGHSLGAYLAAAYAERHPERVAKLVLLSPAGVLGDPEAEQPSREITDDQAKGATKEQVKAAHAEQKAKKEQESLTRRFFTYLWEDGWSPFQVVRSLTVFGPMLVGKYSSRRFSGLSEEETRNVHDYILNITLAKGSGEYCISHILTPFAHARMPLVDRVDKLKMPVRFVYGSHDWMDPLGGEQSVERLHAAGNRDAINYLVEKAGHHVYLDNPDYVNDLLLKELSFE
ncbi:alpha/beta-hydrolase [Fomitiporia mediterranea MF3/22]|uniref:alpha/beta-hydrolase n=1 Tax=Fomitiporia mediterranea (strain MF3/22) TaxID=694068 RepID=UPI0004409CAF|nr:alpha/beta-hydrolase [Fomitiporia mediterranea MF3/22]EJD00935.1 alpha/beta-hydrolase [Fomitiporia mediterranea MF3/22]